MTSMVATPSARVGGSDGEIGRDRDVARPVGIGDPDPITFGPRRACLRSAGSR